MNEKDKENSRKIERKTMKNYEKERKKAMKND